ncbi:hypothetical protein BDW74DRAFT_187332 [Aspergillus multicolor]|uniref:uncharacterized protein n=1 Tax=Aspergillus multicolor TaxID=41759 RepID=UPI003CCE0D4E
MASPSRMSIVRVTTSEHVHLGGLANIHLDWSGTPPHIIEASWTSCMSPDSSFSRHIIGRFEIRGQSPQRQAWAVPEDDQTNNSVNPISFTHRAKKRSVADTDNPLLKDFDALGARFDGVAAIQRNSKADAGVASGRSPKDTTSLMLDSVGVHKLPYSVTYKDDNETLRYTDHELTFQLAHILNDMNKNDTRWKIDFIPWIQHSPNELIAQGTRPHPDGRIPTRAEIEADPSLEDAPDMACAEYTETQNSMDAILQNEDTLKSIQRDVWRAHKTAIDEDLDDWSEQAMMRHVFKACENVTDEIWTKTDYDVICDELHHKSNLELDGSKDSLGETHWLCIYGGFNRLSDAFLPHVRDRLTLNRQIRKPESIPGPHDTTKTRLSWYPSTANRTYVSKDYDYTIMAVPFTMKRFMDLPKFSSVLSRAISKAGLRFKSACKVALLFSKRFWEQGPRPIFGGYSKPPYLPVGALYYPVYGHNEARPDPIMHYRGGDWSGRFDSFSDEKHVQTIFDAIVSIHSEKVGEYYAGDYERLCWLQDEHTATAWCWPDHNTIFIGEHTVPTLAWVLSSLQSAVRGVVQLLLELGLVDEAKEVNQRWMGRWIRL